MYLPAHFSEDDPAFVSRFLAEHPLAQLVTLTGSGLVATPLPLLHRPAPDGWGSLVGHVARANHQWSDSGPSAPALVIFSGPQAYVSPGWYPSKGEHGKVVPTWNYECVHVTGTLEAHDDATWTRTVVTELTQRHESGRAQPWSVEDAPPGYIDSMVKAIVGVEVHITSVQAKRKLSQNRSVGDVDGVIGGLRGLGLPDASAAASAMERVRVRPS